MYVGDQTDARRPGCHDKLLGNTDVEGAASQLAEYRRNDALPEILDRYALLIEDYRRLKSDYEEERDARERYKQLARSQERNAFALVLVDGDGYVFREDLLASGEEGGSRAAQLLNDAIWASLRNKGLDDHCQVVVRVYADLWGLSRRLAKAGLAGAEARSVASFVSGFNRSYGLTDFIDAGQHKENADFKLRALLRFYADSAQCKHIYWAACHDGGYVAELTPHRGNSNRFTLVKTSSAIFLDPFAKLGMGVEELHGMFRATPLPQDAAATTRASGPAPTSATTKAAAADKEGQRSICRYYRAGVCKYGQGCKNLHFNDRADASRRADDAQPDREPASASWRHFEAPQEPSSTNASSGNQIQNRGKPKTASPDLISNFTVLPSKEAVPQGSVAVNKNDYRLDPYIAPASLESASRFKARIEKRRLCNQFQLNGSCMVGELCEYDHDPLEAHLKPVLESFARSRPCSRRGSCRNEFCTQGHVCQNSACKYRGGKAFCKLPGPSHAEDLAVARFVPANGQEPRSRPPPSSNGSVFDGNDTYYDH